LAEAGEHLVEAQAACITGTDLEMAGSVLAALAELAIWRGDAEEAQAYAAKGLAMLAGSEASDLRTRLTWLSLRADVDRAAQGRRRLRIAGEERRTTVEDPFEPLIGLPMTPRGMAYLTLCHGEHALLQAESGIDEWAAAAETWDRAGSPYLASYAHWHAGEALLVAGADRRLVSEELKRAHAVALRLEAEPLRAKIEAVARRARVRLTAPIGPTHERSAPATQYHLTPREMDVLRLVALGRSNREIAHALFMSEKTASVHVSHILAKLGVASRSEATSLAHRRGMVGVEA
jgi:DNA-binding NarL/FixJ family response regulator